MGKGEVYDLADRIFKVGSDAGLGELGAKKFDDEKQMQNLIERNIGVLFPGLELLESEFGKRDDGKHRLDAIAFHKEENTFVVIEYKNTRNTGVIAQTKSHLKYMREKKAELTLAYNKKTGIHHDTNEFDWNAAYAVIVAPEFSANLIASTEGDADLELYRIGQHGDDAMGMRHVSGKREPVSDEMVENIVRGVEAYRNGERFYTTEHMLKILDSDDEQ